jgi:hypothetical protein
MLENQKNQATERSTELWCFVPLGVAAVRKIKATCEIFQPGIQKPAGFKNQKLQTTNQKPQTASNIKHQTSNIKHSNSHV